MSFLFSRKGEGAEGLGHSQVTRSWSVVAQSMPAQVTVSQRAWWVASGPKSARNRKARCPQGPWAWQVRTGEDFAKQILCSPLPQVISGPHSLIHRPRWKLAPAMLGWTLLGLTALSGLGAGAPLCLSQQLRMQGDYMLGGLFPLGTTDDAGLGGRIQPNATVCTR